MRETLSIFLGQSGAQIGQACWELFCLEHAINTNGVLIDQQNVIPGTDCIFNPCRQQQVKYTPRTVFADLDTIPIDSVRTGSQKNLFTPDQLISHNKDSCSNFARAKYTIGKEMVEKVKNQINKQLEACDSVDSLLFFHSTAGGMGSGFHSLLCEQLKDLKCNWASISLMPSATIQTNPLSYYNTVLGFTAQQNQDLDIVIQNEAMLKVIKNACMIDNGDLPEMNNLLAQCTTQMLNYRFGQGISLPLSALAKALVPYPKVPFTMMSTFCMPEDDIPKTNISAKFLANQSIKGTDFYLTQADFRHGKFIAIAPLFRGDTCYADVKQAMTTITASRLIQTVDFMPDNYTIGLTHQQPVGTKLPTTLTTLSTTTAIGEVFSRISHHFDLMYAKKAYIQQYAAEGMEEGELAEAREEWAAGEKNYEECCMDTAIEDDDKEAES